MKKLDSKGFGAVEGLLILIIVGIIGGAGFYVYKVNSDTQDSLNNIGESEITQNNSAKEQEKKEDPKSEQVPEGFTKYDNNKLGISFIYPSVWGEVTKAEFDQQGNSEYFEFTKFEGLTVGGLQKDYTHPGRGGSLIDYGGFTKDGNNFKFRSREDKTAAGEAKGYKLNTPGNCIFSTGVEFFEKPAYHAVCNLNNGDTFGFNFAVYDTSKITTSQFLAVVNSVSIE